MSSTSNINCIVSLVSSQRANRVTFALALANILCGTLLTLSSTNTLSALVLQTPSLANLVITSILLLNIARALTATLTVFTSKSSHWRNTIITRLVLALNVSTNTHTASTSSVLSPRLTVFISSLDASNWIFFNTEVW